MKKILIVAYYYPPESNGGTERVRQFYMKLKEEGFDTYVLTADKLYLHKKTKGQADDHIIRNWGLWAAVRAYDGFIRKYKIKINFLSSIANRLIRKTAKKILPDVCIASFPLSYDFDIGLRIKECLNCKLVADFRDGLLFCPFSIVENGNKLYKDKMNRLEKDIVSYSDLIITVSPQHAEYFSKNYGVGARVIPNGFDHLEKIDCESLDFSAYGFTVLFTGGIDSSRPGQFEYVKKCLEGMFEDNLDITFIFVGNYNEYEISFFSKYKNVILYPRQLRNTVIATQKRANVLLAITGDDTSGTSGKLYEYLFAEAPVLNIGGDNNAARIIRESNAGTTISPHERNKINKYLENVRNNNVDVTRRNIMQYTRLEECHKLAEYIRGLFK